MRRVAARHLPSRKRLTDDHVVWRFRRAEAAKARGQPPDLVPRARACGVERHEPLGAGAPRSS